jgi:cell division transport system permease protein
MFNRIGYVMRETGASLRRNLTLTVAAVLTAAVSLFLAGFFVLVQRAFSNFLIQWRGGVEFIVFLNPDVTPEQLSTVEASLDENGQVESMRFIDKDEAYEELKRLYPNSPAIVESVTPADMPPSFRVVPTTDDPEIIEAVGRQIATQPGVFQVEFAKEIVDGMRQISNIIRIITVVLAIAALTAATILIWNTIRTAMFARRREIEIMKLVGATNWFIRVPFMLEGLLQGLLGGLLAWGGLTAANWLWTSRAVSVQDLQLDSLRATAGEFRFSVILVLGLGALVGAGSSAIAASRFLDV